jgi:hypothetical protein
MDLGQHSWIQEGGLYDPPLRWSFPTPTSSVLSNSVKTAITGIELEDDFSGATIGKDIPVFIGGSILAGCKLIEGPFLTTVSSEGFVNYIVSPFAVAVPEATRELTSLRLNGTESFTSGDGGTTWTESGAVFAGVTINVLYGTEQQLPFASSSDRYNARAVPYRSHVCIELQVVPLTPFANLIPFVSVQVDQDDGLTRLEAVERILRYTRFDDSEFEVEVSGEDVFWVYAGQDTVFEFLQNLQTSGVGRNWNVVATDKLRIFENSSTVTPIEIAPGDVAAGSVRFWQDPPESVAAEFTFGFVDTDGDNAYNTVRARRSRFPIPLTASQDSQEIDVPIGMSRAQASVIANNKILIDHFARDKFACKLLPHKRGIQPGDIVQPTVDAAITWLYRVLSCAKNSADFTIDIIAERIELSLLPTGPSITSNGGGATASITINEGATAVTTVTSDQSGTFSIAGGDDSSFFTIHPTTGVLTITARDYEDPQDADTNNTYEVIVQVIADGLAGTQIITVTIANVGESGDSGVPMGLLLTLTYP